MSVHDIVITYIRYACSGTLDCEARRNSYSETYNRENVVSMLTHISSCLSGLMGEMTQAYAGVSEVFGLYGTSFH